MSGRARGRKRTQPEKKPKPKREPAPARNSVRNLTDKAKKQKEARAGNPPGSRSGNPTDTSHIDSLRSVSFSDSMNKYYRQEFQRERQIRDNVGMGPRGSFLRDEAMFVSNRRGPTAGNNQYHAVFGRNLPPAPGSGRIPGGRDRAIMGAYGRRRYVYPPHDGKKRYID